MEKRKNILLISVDDMFAFWRYRDALGVRLQTPNLDRIIERSTLFRSAYCQAPVCGPSRASAMSGLSPFQTGIFDNYINIFDVLRPEQMWQHRIKRAGYYCSTAGKVHHGYKPLAPEHHNPLYSHPGVAVFFGPRRGAPSKRFGGKTSGSGTTDLADDLQYYDSRSSRHAIRFLDKYTAPDPFYREVGFHHPHLPFQTPVRFKEMYDEAAFEQPKAWMQGFDLSPYAQKYLKENIDPSDTSYWQKTLRNYYSCISHVDTHIGAVWDALQASPHAKDTVVMIFSDHGYHLGDKGRFRKCTLYEEATRVPLIIHDPDATPGQVDDPVGLIDMGATLLDYAGCRPLCNSPGRSLRGLVHGGRDPDRAVPTFWYGNVSARVGNYRISVYQDGSTEFHDVENDPWLNTNLGAAHPDYAACYRALIAVVADHGGQMPTGHTMAAGPYAAHTLGTGAGQLGTRGAVSVETVADTVDTPGYRTVYVTPQSKSCEMEIPAGANEVYFASDINGGLTDFSVRGNDRDNRVFLNAGHARFTFRFDAGRGHNHIYASHDPLRIKGGPGSIHVQGSDNDDEMIGGTGSNVFQARHGNNRLDGGPGVSFMTGGDGIDHFVTGTGQSIIRTGPGENTIEITGGINEMTLDQRAQTLIFKRTGLPQRVIGFVAGHIDVSDWSVLGKVTFSQDGADVIMSVGTERAVFVSAALEDVEAAVLSP